MEKALLKQRAQLLKDIAGMGHLNYHSRTYNLTLEIQRIDRLLIEIVKAQTNKKDGE